MNKKAFTLIELLAALLIISLLGAIGIISYRTVFKTAEERYYNAIESNMVLAGNDYYEDHRNQIPIGSEYSVVGLDDLIDSKYLEQVKDTNGNVCTTGSVFAYRENNKLKYEACLECGDYKTSGRFCNTVASRLIRVKSKKVGSSEYDYDVLRSYSNQSYSNGLDILVELSMANEYEVDKYVVTNTKDSNIQYTCEVESDSSCNVTIGKTGIYRVVAYDINDVEISSRYINAKIAKDGSLFSLKADEKYLITENECASNKNTKKVKITVLPGSNEEYKKIEYQINSGEIKSANSLIIEEELPSGHYEVEVAVTNHMDNVSVETVVFDIAFPITLTYQGTSETETFEVVTGESYSYLKEFPSVKEIDGVQYQLKWFKDGVRIYPTEENVGDGNNGAHPVATVTDNCSFTLLGKTLDDYYITYDLDGGETNNPTIYNKETPNFTLSNPTKSGSTFLGWSGSNDKNSGTEQYTMENPYVAGARDHIIGNEFSVTSGSTYRVYITAKRISGALPIQGGIWYTEKTSGTAYEGYNVGEFVEISSLGNGWSKYYKDITIPAGKTKGRTYFQLEQTAEAYVASWQIADIHIVIPSQNITIFKGSTGDRHYNAYWKTSHTLTINPNGGTYNGTTSVTNTSGEKLTILNNPTRPGYTFTGWTFTGGGAFDGYDTTSTPVTTKTLNYNASNSTVPTVYNNSGGGTVTAAMVADSTATGGYSLKITTNGAASPGAGGVILYNLFPADLGRINVLEIKAKIPTGYNIYDGGNGSYYRGMGSYINNTMNYGTTDRWKTYYLIYYTGTTGVNSETSYLHISGTNNTSVTWYINSITMKSYTKDQFKSKFTFGGDNATLTARWDNSGSSVVFNTNGGTFNNTYVKSWTNNFFDANSTTARRFYFYNSAYNVHPGSTNYNWTPDSRVTTRSGYTFDGWYTAASGGTKVFNADGTLVYPLSGYSNAAGGWAKYDANITLYAHWASQSYTVTYNENLGQMDAWATSYKERFTRNYDSSTGLYNISLAGDGGWELLYLPISTTSGHQYRVTFDYVIPAAYNSSYNGIGYQAVTQLNNSNLSSYNLTTGYLPKVATSRTNAILNFTAVGTTNYFVLNFGMAPDGVTTTIKVGNVKVYDVTSGTYVYAPSKTSQSVSSGGQYGTLASVSRPGYTFAGWYTAPSGGTKIETSTIYNAGANQTLYAHWTMGTYSQVYRSNGGNAGNSASETIGYWDIWTSKAASTYNKAGYTFNCWQSSTSSSCYGGGGWFYASAGVGSSRYLDATWTANGYTLTFNANGGSVSTSTKAITYGTTYTDLPTPTRTGFRFKGWYGNYTGSNYTNYGRAYMYSNKLSLHFSAYMSNWANYGRAISCTETGGWNFESSSGNIVSAVYDSGVGYKNPISNVQYSSLSAGWHDFDLIFNGTNAKIYVDGSLKATSANYSSGNIGYNATNSIFIGGEATSSNSTASSPFFTGYVGNVVIKNTDALTSSSTYNSISAPAQNQTLYARWEPIMHKVSLNPQSATTNGTSEAWWQEKVTNPVGGVTCYYYTNSSMTGCLANGYTITVPTKTGHTFQGYYTGTNGSGTQYINSSGTFVNNLYQTTSDITLYAYWTKNNYYLDLNGRLDSTDSGNIDGYGTCDVYINGTQVANDVTDYYQAQPYGSTYEIKDCKATTGHTYRGVSSGSLTGTIGASTTSVKVYFTTNTYTVTLAGVNPIGTSFDNQTVTLAGNVGVPVFASSTLNLSTSTNYVVSFDYKAASGSNQFDVDFFPDSLPQTNPTATASWQHMDWITSSTNSAMGSCQLRFFDDFQGSGETDITITNIMLSRTSTKTVTYGGTYGDLTTPSRSGYTFVGWYTASSGGTKVINTSQVTTAGNHTLYARWSKNAVTYTKKTYNCQYANWATSVEYISGTGCSTSGSSSGASYQTCDLVDAPTYCHSYNNKCWKRTTYRRSGCSTWFTTPVSTETGLSSCTPSQDFYTKVTCE